MLTAFVDPVIVNTTLAVSVAVIGTAIDEFTVEIACACTRLEKVCNVKVFPVVTKPTVPEVGVEVLNVYDRSTLN